jgi:Mg2+ and Co2+ transporter CorA
MLRDRLKELFKGYPPAIQQIIREVGEIEQQYISMEKPRGIMKDIDEMLTRIAGEELERSNGGN